MILLTTVDPCFNGPGRLRGRLVGSVARHEASDEHVFRLALPTSERGGPKITAKYWTVAMSILGGMEPTVGYQFGIRRPSGGVSGQAI